MRRQETRCGFGEMLPEYIVERWTTRHRIVGDRLMLQLTMEDLPILAKAFGLEWKVEDGKLTWTCGVCGELGSVLACDRAKHTEHYLAIEQQHRADKRGRNG